MTLLHPPQVIVANRHLAQGSKWHAPLSWQHAESCPRAARQPKLLPSSRRIHPLCLKWSNTSIHRNCFRHHGTFLAPLDRKLSCKFTFKSACTQLNRHKCPRTSASRAATSDLHEHTSTLITDHLRASMIRVHIRQVQRDVRITPMQDRVSTHHRNVLSRPESPEKPRLNSVFNSHHLILQRHSAKLHQCSPVAKGQIVVVVSGHGL